MQYFRTQSRLSIDLKSTQVPVATPGFLRGNILVLYADADRIVDITVSRQTALFFNADLEVIPGPDMMLCSHRRTNADKILKWLEHHSDRDVAVPHARDESI